MSKKTGVDWADAMWNPWVGCNKVSAECANCYFFRDAQRFNFSPELVRRTKTFEDPIKWRKSRGVKPGGKIMVCGWSDFFHEKADEWRADAWKVMRMLDEYVFIIATKRPERIRDHLPTDWVAGYPNVWLGVSVGHPDSIWRIAELQSIPAAVRFISAEPVIAPVALSAATLENIHWIIIGGESGYNARPMHPEWAADLIAASRASCVPVYFKQWGVWTDGLSSGVEYCDCLKYVSYQFHDRCTVYRTGMEIAGHKYNGAELHEYPAAYAYHQQKFSRSSKKSALNEKNY